MKNDTADYMVENGIIPHNLVGGWNSRNNELPGALQSTHVDDQFLFAVTTANASRIMFVIFTLAFLVLDIAGEISSTRWEAFAILVVLGICLFLRYCSSRPVVFVKDLENLQQALDIPWAHLFKSTAADHQSDVELILISRAMNVIATEESNGMNSAEARSAKLDFEDTFDACQKFSLTNKTWNRYFAEAHKRLPAPVKSEDVPELVSQ